MKDWAKCNIRNYTEHDVMVRSGSQKITFNSVGCARIYDEYDDTKSLTGVLPVYKVDHRVVVGLPEEKDNTLYIVSYMVRIALPFRKDLISPYGLERNSSGKVVSCKGFLLS